MEKLSNDLAESVAESVTENYTDQGYHLYIDNYYSKVWLINSFKDKGIYVGGTVLTDRSDFPKEIAISSKREGTWLH